MMKKIVFLLTMGFYCLCGQAQQSHLTFMGFPMNERIENFMQKLRAMGFVGEYKEDSYGGAIPIEMKGSYRGKPVKLSIYTTSKSKLVYEVDMRLYKPNLTEAEAREVFKTWKQFLVPNPGPLMILDERRTRNNYSESLMGQINTDIGTISLHFSYTQKGGIKKDFLVYISFTDTQNFNKHMSEDWVEIDEGNQGDQNREKHQISQSENKEFIIVEPPFPPNEVSKIISTYTPKGSENGERKGTNNENEKGNDHKPIYPPSSKPPKPIPGPWPIPKPHHWGHVKVETDTTDVLIEINAIDFIRQLFFTNDYNKVKQLIMSTPSLTFKKTEEKKEYFVASRTEGECEEIWLRRPDKKSNNIDVLRITIKQWDEEEIIEYLHNLGYREISQKQEDMLGNPAITRTYSNGDASHIVEFFFLKRTDPIKSILFKRK